jgi:hypothetical protein
MVLVLIPYSPQNSHRYLFFTFFFKVIHMILTMAPSSHPITPGSHSLLDHRLSNHDNVLHVDEHAGFSSIVHDKKDELIDDVVDDHDEEELATSELSSINGEFSATDGDVKKDETEITNCASSSPKPGNVKNTNANNKYKQAKEADCQDDVESASSQPSNHDGDDSKEDNAINKVHKQNAHSLSSNELPDNDKTSLSNNLDDGDTADVDNTDDEDYVDSISKSSKTSPRSTTDILFTTGLGFTAEKQSELRTLVESAASKDEFSQAFKPNKDLYCLVFWWARKPPYHFAADILNSNAVVACEAGLSLPFYLCQLYGWILIRHNSDSSRFHIQCKRFQECLTNAKFNSQLATRPLTSME